MKKLYIICVIFAVLSMACVASKTTTPQSTEQQASAEGSVLQQGLAAELTFSYTRLSGPASNQYAVWIEDAQGNFIKTIYAALWTANGGWRRRPASIPIWVRVSGLENLSNEQIDAVSGATPRTGNMTYTWDGTNSHGAFVPDGDYVLFLEGTLRWENQVLYRAPIRLGQGAVTAEVSVEYSGDAGEDRAMIANVAVQTLR